MLRWYGVVALLLSMPAVAARAQDDPEAPAVAAEAAGPASDAPAEPERFAVPVLGRAVAAKVEMGAIAFRDVTLLRQRGPNGEPLLGARVRLTNAGETPLAPAFRLFLYRGQDPIGSLLFPAPGGEAKTVVAGSTYTWTEYLSAEGKPFPDAFAIAPPERRKESVGGAAAATPVQTPGVVPFGGAPGGKPAPGGVAGPGAKQKGVGKGGMGRAGAGMGNAKQKMGGGLPNNILKAPGMRAGGVRKPKMGGGLKTKGMRQNAFTAPGMRQAPGTKPGKRR